MLARWNYPLEAFEELRREMDNLFGSLGRGFDRLPLFGPRGFPALNLWEDGNHLYAEAEVPGLNMQDLEVHVVGNELTIKGRRPGLDGKNLTYHRRERGVGEFTRFLTLPVEVNQDRVEAVLKDGVLTITMPKAESAKARKITVRSQ